MQRILEQDIKEGNGFTKFDNEYDAVGSIVADSICIFLNAYIGY
jgi:hypothetical protein